MKEEVTKQNEIKKPHKSPQNKLKLVALDLPVTKPIKESKNYMKPTRSIDPKAQVKTTQKGNIDLTKGKTDLAKKPKNEENNQRTSKSPVPAAKSKAYGNNYGAISERESTRHDANRHDRSRSNISKAGGNKLKETKKTAQIEPNNQKNTSNKGPVATRPKSKSLLDDSLFNNDDLFSKLNKLTKLNQKAERHDLIENGFIEYPEKKVSGQDKF